MQSISLGSGFALCWAILRMIVDKTKMTAKLDPRKLDPRTVEKRTEGNNE